MKAIELACVASVSVGLESKEREFSVFCSREKLSENLNLFVGSRTMFRAGKTPKANFPLLEKDSTENMTSGVETHLQEKTQSHHPFPHQLGQCIETLHLETKTCFITYVTVEEQVHRIYLQYITPFTYLYFLLSCYFTVQPCSPVEVSVSTDSPSSLCIMKTIKIHCQTM